MNKKLITIVVLCLAILIGGIAVSSGSPVNKSNFVRLIENTDYCIDCHTIYKITKAADLSPQLSNVGLSFHGKKLENAKDRITDLRFQVLKDDSYEILVEDYRDITYDYTCTNNNFNYTLNPNYAWCWSNSLNENASYNLLFSHYFDKIDADKKTIYWTRKKLFGTTTERKYGPVWRDVELNSLKQIIRDAPVGSSWDVKVSGRIGFGDWVDNVISFAGYSYDEYAVWNGNQITIPFDNKTAAYFNDSSTAMIDNASGYGLAGTNSSNNGGVNSTMFECYVGSYNNGWCDSTAEPVAKRDCEYLDDNNYAWADGNSWNSVNAETWAICNNTNDYYIARWKIVWYTPNQPDLFQVEGADSFGATNATWSERIYLQTDNETDTFYYDSGRETKNMTFAFPIKSQYFRYHSLVTPFSQTLSPRTEQQEWDFYQANFLTKSYLLSNNITYSSDVDKVNVSASLTEPTGTNVNISISCDNGANWVTCNDGDIDCDCTDGSDIRYNITFTTTSIATSAQVHNLTISVLESASVNETLGRAAIQDGIDASAISGATVYTDYQVYERDIDNTQGKGTFDKFAVYGDQRWAFNYRTGSEAFTGMFNLTPVLYITEFESMTYSKIKNLTETTINNTVT